VNGVHLLPFLAPLLLMVGLSGAACDDGGGEVEAVIEPGDEGRYAPEIDPATFVDRIDNPFLPLLPGARWVYEGEVDGELERVEVVVTDERREVMGVSTVVVRDTVTVDGELEEETFDWFAQDADGNVWYFGEDSREYEDGEVASTEGSWEAGVDDALPGIVMEASPTVGDAYRQEYYPGEAEDLAEVTALDGTEAVPVGTYQGVLVTKEWTPLEPDTIEEKRYAAGVGLIVEVGVEPDRFSIELLEHRPGG
jgi:hypothetical protein